jgi:signal-transduction protein with cAMP-binding, CBS, and nucleotidyltransferase domain
VPLTILVRVLCTKNGIWETHTLKRINALTANQLLDDKTSEELKEAYYFLLSFRALYQMTRIANQLPAANAVDPLLLDTEGQERLRHSLSIVESFQDRINQSFFGGNS